MEDREIVELFWDRDERAIPAVQEKYGARLGRMAERMLGSREDAEECVSDACLNAWNAIPPERPLHLGAYLSRLCRNAALNRLDWNSAQKRKAEVVSLTAELETCIPDAWAARQAEGRELGALLTAFLRSLPEEQRLVFLRRYWYSQSVQEIAEGCGFSRSKVKTMLLRVRRKLRTYLEREGITV